LHNPRAELGRPPTKAMRENRSYSKAKSVDCDFMQQRGSDFLPRQVKISAAMSQKTRVPGMTSRREIGENAPNLLAETFDIEKCRP
jgi:hypothetical protein